MTDPNDPRPDGGVETRFGYTPASAGRNRLVGIGTIARTEYRLAVRNRWAIALAVIFAAFALGFLTFSGASVGPEGFSRTVASLAVLAVYLVPLAAMAFGFDVIVGADEDGWLAALFALPIARWRIGIGAYLGRALAFAAAVALGFGIPGLILLAEVGVAGWEGYAIFLFASIGLGLSFLGIAAVLSSIAREKTHALGASLAVWAWFVLIHDLLALGIFAAFRLPDSVLTAVVLSNPAGIFRVLVLGSLGATGEAGFASVLAAVGLGTVQLAVSLGLWIVIPAILVGIIVQRRRL